MNTETIALLRKFALESAIHTSGAYAEADDVLMLATKYFAFLTSGAGVATQ